MPSRNFLLQVLPSLPVVFAIESERARGTGKLHRKPTATTESFADPHLGTARRLRRRVCAEAGDGREAVEKAQQLKPDIVILDLGMPNLNGLIAARQILRIRPDQKILILTITDEEQVVREVLEAGARGFVLKSDAARDLVAAVEALQAGTTFFTSRIGEMVLRAYLDKGRGGSERVPDLSSLTSRERGMVQLLAEGKRLPSS